jgi:hypothetical protein
MEWAMARPLRSEMKIYLDNTIMFSETLAEHIIRLERVLRNQAKKNFIIEPKKCLFLKYETRILRPIVGGGKIRMNPEKTSVILE